MDDLKPQIGRESLKRPFNLRRAGTRKTKGAQNRPEAAILFEAS
jgi:hypothetical protein